MKLTYIFPYFGTEKAPNLLLYDLKIHEKPNNMGFTYIYVNDFLFKRFTIYLSHAFRNGLNCQHVKFVCVYEWHGWMRFALTFIVVAVVVVGFLFKPNIKNYKDTDLCERVKYQSVNRWPQQKRMNDVQGSYVTIMIRIIVGTFSLPLSDFSRAYTKWYVVMNRTQGWFSLSHNKAHSPKSFRLTQLFSCAWIAKQYKTYILPLIIHIHREIHCIWIFVVSSFRLWANKKRKESSVTWMT